MTIKSYALKPMVELWGEPGEAFYKSKFEHWNGVELAVLRARAELGELPLDVYGSIARSIRITKETVERIKLLNKRFRHDKIAFIAAIQEILKEAGLGEYAHEYDKNLTSYDIEDPALILMLRKAIDLILEECFELEKVLRKRAKDHKRTLMIARTHGQYAEPTTFGHLLMVFAEMIARSIRRLRVVLDHELMEGKVSGAVGIYGPLDPRVEEVALTYLGLKPAKAETQILQRDRHATVLAMLAVLAGSIEQMARTFWQMMESDRGELRESFGEGQRGSSIMAWKRNPIVMERLQGLASLVRGDFISEAERIATPDFRDISQSIVERHTLPDVTTLVYYAVVSMRECVENMEVFPDKMKRNLDRTYGVWAGTPIRAALMNAGIDYDIAYNYIQRAGFFASDREIEMFYVLCGVGGITLSEEDSRIAEKILGMDALAKFFRPMDYVKRGVEHIFRYEKPS